MSNLNIAMLWSPRQPEVTVLYSDPIEDRRVFPFSIGLMGIPEKNEKDRMKEDRNPNLLKHLINQRKQLEGMNISWAIWIFFKGGFFSYLQQKSC